MSDRFRARCLLLVSNAGSHPFNAQSTAVHGLNTAVQVLEGDSQGPCGPWAGARHDACMHGDGMFKRWAHGCCAIDSLED